jgi:hypothetical protein
MNNIIILRSYLEFFLRCIYLIILVSWKAADVYDASKIYQTMAGKGVGWRKQIEKKRRVEKLVLKSFPLHRPPPQTLNFCQERHCRHQVKDFL